MTSEYLDRLPDGSFVLLMRTEARKWDWVAWVIDPHTYCIYADAAELGVDPIVPKDERKAQQCRPLRIPGKHRNRDAAWAALEAMIATRH